jgi:hypothetical protein
VSRRPAQPPALRLLSMLAPDTFVFDTRIRDDGRARVRMEGFVGGNRLPSTGASFIRIAENRQRKNSGAQMHSGDLHLSQERRPDRKPPFSFRREVKIRNVETINFQSASSGPAPVRELNSPKWARRAAGARGRLRRRQRREHGRSRAWRRRPARAEPTHKPRHWCASRCLREPSRGGNHGRDHESGGQKLQCSHRTSP